jgi:hypothetical protein
MACGCNCGPQALVQNTTRRRITGPFVGTLLAVIRYTSSNVRCLIAATWGLILLKLVISVPGLYIEHRYTVVVSPFIELDCVLVGLAILQRRAAYIRFK